MPESDLQVRLQVAKQATHIAGEELRRFFRVGWPTQREIDVKSAQAAAQESILTFLRQVYPQDAIWGRDMGDLPASKTLWVVDSLNGRENYTIGDDTFSTSVAWIENGQPLLGVVASPIRKQLFAAVKGKGTTLNNQPLNTRVTNELAGAHVLASLAGSEDAIERSLGTIRAFSAAMKQVSIRQAPALDICAVAEGTHDAFVHHAIEPWDWIAAQLILEEAGGKLTDLEHKRPTVKAGEILASNGLLHEQLLKLL